MHVRSARLGNVRLTSWDAALPSKQPSKPTKHMPGAGRAKNWTAGSCNVPTWPGLLATSRAPNLATHTEREHPFVAKHIPDTSQASKKQYLPEHGHVHDTSEHKTTGSSTQVHVRMQLSAVARGEGSVVGPARLSSASRRRATKKKSTSRLAHTQAVPVCCSTAPLPFRESRVKLLRVIEMMDGGCGRGLFSPLHSLVADEQPEPPERC